MTFVTYLYKYCTSKYPHGTFMIKLNMFLRQHKIEDKEKKLDTNQIRNTQWST